MSGYRAPLPALSLRGPRECASYETQQTPAAGQRGGEEYKMKYSMVTVRGDDGAEEIVCASDYGKKKMSKKAFEKRLTEKHGKNGWEIIIDDTTV
jgi:hypothetical protein